MQCCFGKCWKSFHATCAVKNGATMERKAGMQKNTFVYDGYCPQHDPVSYAPIFKDIFTDNNFSRKI